MKKKIEADIHSLATDLLNNKKKGSTQEWKEFTMQLYEKLCVLEYLEGQLGISQDALNNEAKTITDRPTELKPVSETTEPIVPKEVETNIEAIQKDEKPLSDMDFGFELDTAIADSEKVKTKVEIKQDISEIKEVPLNVTAEPTKTPIQPEKRQAHDLQRFASTYKQTPVFSRKQTTTTDEQPRRSNNSMQAADKPKSINDSLNRGLHIALNDRIAFINNLFEGSAQDFNRVLSQINTMDDFDAVQNFLNHQIKPDYKHWEGKEEYSERFITIIEKKFS